MQTEAGHGGRRVFAGYIPFWGWLLVGALYGVLGGCAGQRVLLRQVSGWRFEASKDQSRPAEGGWYEVDVWDSQHFPILKQPSRFAGLYLFHGFWRGPAGEKALFPKIDWLNDDKPEHLAVYATGPKDRRNWYAAQLGSGAVQELRCPPERGGGAPLWAKVGRVGEGAPVKLLVSCEQEQWLVYEMVDGRLAHDGQEHFIPGDASAARSREARDKVAKAAAQAERQRRLTERDPLVPAGEYCVVWLFKTDRSIGLADSAWDHEHWILMVDLQLSRGGRMSELKGAVSSKVLDNLPIHRDFYLVVSRLPHPNVWNAWSIGTSRCGPSAERSDAYVSRIAVRL